MLNQLLSHAGRKSRIPSSINSVKSIRALSQTASSLGHLSSAPAEAEAWPRPLLVRGLQRYIPLSTPPGSLPMLGFTFAHCIDVTRCTVAGCSSGDFLLTLLDLLLSHTAEASQSLTHSLTLSHHSTSRSGSLVHSTAYSPENPLLMLTVSPPISYGRASIALPSR